MPERPEDLAALDQLWNDLVSGRSPASGAPNPEDVAALQAFYALVAPPPPASLARVDDAMARAIAQRAGSHRLRRLALPTPPPSANGAGGPVGLADLPAAPARRWRLPSLAALVTAALVLLLLLGATAALRLRQRGPATADRPVLTAPAASGTPGAAPIIEELWESQGNPATPLFLPGGVTAAPDGRIWVADGSRGQFQIFAPDGAFVEAWGVPGSGNGQFSFKGSGDVAFDAAGNSYVADTGNFRIQKFSPDRTFLTAWGTRGTGAGQFLSPRFITISPAGDVYVTDDSRSQILRFDARGRFLNTIGEPGGGDGQLNTPGGIAVDRDGTVWVSDYNNNRIVQFSPDGTFLRAWGTAGNREGELRLPCDIAFDAQGFIYVLESGNKRIQVFDRDFRPVTTAGREDLSAQPLPSGPNPGQRAWFMFPAAMALNTEGRLYITDTMGNAVAAFRTRPAGAAASAPPGAGADSTRLMQALVTGVPARDLWLGLEQVRLEPSAEWRLDHGDGDGPLLYRVESGQVTVTFTGDGAVTRAGATRPGGPGGSNGDAQRGRSGLPPRRRAARVAQRGG
ncbi:MAG: NHL repeat-containing protein [Thermomicrobiales bacterium]